MNISGKDVLNMMNDTSKLLSKESGKILSAGAIGAHSSNVLSNEVEFWTWMQRNYSGSGIFDSADSMQNYISSGAGKEAWLGKQLQGKGYEWDWMSQQRGNIKNIFKRYDAGDVANRFGSDVTETNIFTGKQTDYQMKAYTSKTNPNLKNTPKDMNIVTNAEKVDVVKGNGYENVQSYKDAQSIDSSTNKRMEDIKSGRVNTAYNFKNVAGTMGKAGLTGCVIGMGIETVASYKQWKNGYISDEQYIKEILKSGGESGTTAALTSGVMIPISAAVTAAGMSTVITIPIAFAVSGAINKVVAPCFGRGEYRQILSEAKYYQNMNGVYQDLVESMENASQQYYNFVLSMEKQNAIYQQLKRMSMEKKKDLKRLYDSI